MLIDFKQHLFLVSQLLLLRQLLTILSVFAQNNVCIYLDRKHRLIDCLGCHRSHSLCKQRSRLLVCWVPDPLRCSRKDQRSLPRYPQFCSGRCDHLPLRMPSVFIYRQSLTSRQATVMTSGFKVLTLVKWTRRDRFIVAAAMSFGMGNLLVDDWFAYVFTYSGDNTALRGFMNVSLDCFGCSCSADVLLGSGHHRLYPLSDLRYCSCVSLLLSL